MNNSKNAPSADQLIGGGLILIAVIGCVLAIARIWSPQVAVDNLHEVKGGTRRFYTG